MKQIPTYPLRRHRPGHTTRMPDIRAFLDANSGSDPLQGNYVLIKLEDIVLNFQGESNLFELMAFTAAAGALQQTGRYTGTQIGGSPVAICAGDFDGDGADEIASLYNDAGQLNLLLARNADPATGTQSLSVVTSKENIGTYGGGQLRAVATPIAGRKNLGFIFAWAESGSLSVQVWTTDSSLRPNLYAEGTLTLKIADSNFDLTTADLDGDGVFEIVVLYQGTPQNNQNLFLSTLKLNEQDKLVLDATAAVAEMDGPCQLAISAGAHDPQSVSEQVAVAWSQGGYGKVVLYIYNSGILTPSGSPYVD